MTVAQFIRELEKYPQDTEVLICASAGWFLAEVSLDEQFKTLKVVIAPKYDSRTVEPEYYI